ncbi:hypothetical protein MY1884_004880 [Beauveria asiatica]
MPLVEPPPPATLPVASIPDHDTSELESTYNSPSCSSPRPRSLSLSVDQKATTTAATAASSPALDDISDDMLSIHSSKSEPFASAGLGAPALPQKSALRASRLLATLPQKLPEDRTVLTHAAPHLIYLSSEEDGLSSADDLSDLDSFDSDSEESLNGCVTHGEFARVVSVIFSGKPSVINLTGRSTSLTSLRRRPSDDAALRPTSTAPSLGRIRSSSSTSSATSSLNHPPRSSSIITSIDKRRPKFLHVDPFAAGKSDRDDTDSLKTPKTPTAMFSRAFSSLVKKRSRPSLSTVPRENELVHMEQVGEEATEELVEDESTWPKSGGPSKYHNIMTTAKKNAQQVAPASTTPTSPNSAKNGLRSFSLSRRMSIRI